MTGIPCLPVDDAQRAAAYYRDVLGFEQVALLGGAPAMFAVVRKYGATLLLQRVVQPPDRFGPARSGPPWDAVLLVDDVLAAHRELTVRGIDSLGPIDGRGVGWDSFDVSDYCGNVLCIGRAPAGLIGPEPGGGQAGRRVLTTARARWHELQAARALRPHRREFGEFYRRLDDQQQIFYMFFTSGLLHWVAHAESHVPREANLVLLGSALTGDERDWLAANIDRPFHHIRQPMDDVAAWELLFAENPRDFGWLDIDCFVLDGKLFTELTELDPSSSMNCTWSWDTGYDFRLANTHLLYLNAAAIAAVRAQRVSASPSTYDWSGSPRPFRAHRYYMRLPTRRQAELLLRVLPAEPDGRPPLLAGSAYYNTLVLYQLLAKAVGYPVHQVRDLARRCRTPVDAESTDPEHWPEDMSDELFHLFGVSYYQNYDYEPGIRALYLAAEYIMLSNAAPLLPVAYADRLDRLAVELADAGIEPDAAYERFRRHLIEGRRLSPQAADRVLQLAR